jgi:pimeloyl-ACP methyl ester carboxylesterase
MIHEKITGSSMHIIQGVGHCFFWEKPEESARAVIEFLSRVPVSA